MVPCDALATLVTIGIAPLVWILVTHTILVLVTWKPPHQITTIVGTATLHAVSAIDFTRSGAIYLIPNTGALKYLGEDALLWSSTASITSYYAHNIIYRKQEIFPAHYRWGHYGLALRCLAG